MSPSWREALHREEGLATYGIGREQGLQFAVNNDARLRINDGESQVYQSFNIQYSMSPSRTSSYRNLMTVPEVDIATPYAGIAFRRWTQPMPSAQA